MSYVLPFFIMQSANTSKLMQMQKNENQGDIFNDMYNDDNSAEIHQEVIEAPEKVFKNLNDSNGQIEGENNTFKILSDFEEKEFLSDNSDVFEVPKDQQATLQPNQTRTKSNPSAKSNWSNTVLQQPKTRKNVEKAKDIVQQQKNKGKASKPETMQLKQAVSYKEYKEKQKQVNSVQASTQQRTLPKKQHIPHQRELQQQTLLKKKQISRQDSSSDEENEYYEMNRKLANLERLCNRLEEKIDSKTDQKTLEELDQRVHEMANEVDKVKKKRDPISVQKVKDLIVESINPVITETNTCTDNNNQILTELENIWNKIREIEASIRVAGARDEKDRRRVEKNKLKQVSKAGGACLTEIHFLEKFLFDHPEDTENADYTKERNVAINFYKRNIYSNLKRACRQSIYDEVLEKEKELDTVQKFLNLVKEKIFENCV